jgi:hypothetical protein
MDLLKSAAHFFVLLGQGVLFLIVAGVILIAWGLGSKGVGDEEEAQV